jgi:hypothetical protein
MNKEQLIRQWGHANQPQWQLLLSNYRSAHGANVRMALLTRFRDIPHIVAQQWGHG